MASAPPRQLQTEPTPSLGNRTQTQTSAPPTNQQTETRTQTILRLRGAHAPSGPSVRWREDVVDNEGLGRKKSKVCCIYHRPKGVDESSDESSSDSDSSSSDDDSGKEGDGGKREERSGKDHGHNYDGHHHHGRGRRDGDKKRLRRPSPNAYEKMPKNKPKDDGPSGGQGQTRQG